MSPPVEATIIAGSVGILTVIAQIIGFRSTRANTAQQIKANQKDTADTLGHQREQLDRTLQAQTDQLKQTLAEQRTRTLNERFATAADRLGSDKPPAVRLAGVYAMSGLADDWPENRQTCVDVLCAYRRMPYEPDPAEGLAFRADREVRQTLIRIITAHLKEEAAVSWQDLNFDFTGVVFDGGDFSGAEFSGALDFRFAKFSAGTVDFGFAKFSGALDLRGAEFSGGTVDFSFAKFSGGMLDFGFAKFSGGTVRFGGAEFSGPTVDFSRAADWSFPPAFPWTSAPPPGVKLPKKEDQSPA
jgi:hypothetical protein